MNKQSYNLEPQELGHTIQTLIEYIKKGDKILDFGDLSSTTDDIKIKYNDSIILKPDYQRDYRSTISEESSLIESVLIGIPIPPIFLASNKIYDIQVLNVVDGQHRLRAFLRYVDDEFALKDLPILEELNNKKFSDLELSYKQKILSHKLPSYVFRNFPGKKCELEVFNRYNKGTKPLSPQEIRNAVYNSSYNEFINLFVNRIFSSKEDNLIKLKKAYNITLDRKLKKKVHESIFVILYILEFGINEEFKDSSNYSEEYMKMKAENDEPSEFKVVKNNFNKFNEFLLKLIDYIEYPFSKEIYGVESRNYKFQMSIAMILAAVFKKKYINSDIDNLDINNIISLVKSNLLNSFLEDPNYRASTTNSKELNKLVSKF